MDNHNHPLDAVPTTQSPFALITRRFIDPLSTALHKQKTHRNAEPLRKVDNTINKQSCGKVEEYRIPKVAKVLLVGQSESGKSTLLKHFQLAFAPNSFHQERLAWRPVVYLNLVHSIKHILDTLSFPGETVLDHPIPESNQSPLAASNSIFDSPEYAELRVQLQPLLDLEFELTKRLPHGQGSEVVKPISSSSGSPSAQRKVTASNRENVLDTVKNIHDLIAKEVPNWWNDPTDPCHALNGCKPYIEKLWNDATIKSELARRNVYPEEMPGFYLDSLSRITDIRYTPSDDDVLKSRLKTVGVVERVFPAEASEGGFTDWNIIYDVAGASNQCQALVQYFESIGTLIFLAPISAFDETLTEDPKINRLEDSFSIWQSIVSNRFLAGVSIVLFLTKCDLLKAKLDRGVRVSQYIPSYEDRPNDYDSVLQYFENTFLKVHQSSNPNRRIICHQTNVTDTSQTSSIIEKVRETILYNELRACGIL